MFRWLRRLLSGPIRASDALFGEMRYMGGYWEAQGRFPPTGATVEYFVSGDESGPSEGHRQALLEIVDRYTTLLPQVQVALRRVSEVAGQTPPAIDALQLTGVEVPAQLAPDTAWELMFEAPDGLFLAVAMQGVEPTGAVEWSK